MPKFTPEEIQSLRKQGFSDKLIVDLAEKGTFVGGEQDGPLIEAKLAAITESPVKKSTPVKQIKIKTQKTEAVESMRMLLGAHDDLTPAATPKTIRAPQLASNARVGMSPDRLALGRDEDLPAETSHKPTAVESKEVRLLGEILDVLKNSYQAQTDEAVFGKEDKERADDEPEKKDKTPRLQKLTNAMKNSSPAEAFNETLGQDAVGRLLVSAIPGMAKGALVAGAALLGWKAGSLISEFVGLGNSTDALIKLMDRDSQSIQSSLDAIDKGTSEFLKRITFGLFGKTEEQLAVEDSKKSGRAWPPAGTQTPPSSVPTTDGPMDTSATIARFATPTEPTPAVPAPTPVKIDLAAASASFDAASKTPTKTTPTTDNPMPTSATIARPTPAAPAPAPAKIDMVSASASFDASHKTPPPAPAPVARKSNKRDPKTMSFSSAGIEKLVQEEAGRMKDHTTAYLDGDIWAIGAGSHTYGGLPVIQYQHQTVDELKEDMKRRLKNEFEPVVKKSLNRPVTQNEFDSQMSVAWNRGIGAYQDPKFLAKFNAETDTQETWEAAMNPEYIRKHNKKNADKIIQDIKNRRDREYTFSRADNPLRQPASVIAEAGRNGGTTNIVIPQNPPGRPRAPIVVQPAAFPVPVEPRNNNTILAALQLISGFQ